MASALKDAEELRANAEKRLKEEEVRSISLRSARLCRWKRHALATKSRLYPGNK